MSDVKLDSAVFFARAKKLFNVWDVSIELALVR